jgi:hypothetical protein
MDIKNVIEWMDWATIVFAFFAMFGSAFNWWNSRKRYQMENAKIKIIFDVDGVDYLLDLDMPRKHISRSEIQGVLSAFQKVPSQRYSIDYLSNLTFLDDIFKIQNNQKDELKILLSNEEFIGGYLYDNKNLHDGFNPTKMKQL